MRNGMLITFPNPVLMPCDYLSFYRRQWRQEGIDIIRFGGWAATALRFLDCVNMHLNHTIHPCLETPNGYGEDALARKRSTCFHTCAGKLNDHYFPHYDVKGTQSFWQQSYLCNP